MTIISLQLSVLAVYCVVVAERIHCVVVDKIYVHLHVNITTNR